MNIKRIMKFMYVFTPLVLILFIVLLNRNEAYKEQIGGKLAYINNNKYYGHDFFGKRFEISKSEWDRGKALASSIAITFIVLSISSGIVIWYFSTILIHKIRSLPYNSKG